MKGEVTRDEKRRGVSELLEVSAQSLALLFLGTDDQHGSFPTRRTVLAKTDRERVRRARAKSAC